MKYSTGHTVYMNEFGVEVPSVTTILKILNKPALLHWANYLGFKRLNIKDVLEKSSNIGTLVHSMVYAYLMDRYFIFINTELCNINTLKYYMDNFLTWRKTHDIKPIFAEKQITSLDFGGTIDLYCEFDNKKTIIDYKTSKSFYSSMFLQLAGYTMLLEEKGYIVEQVGIVLLHETDYKEKYISRDELSIYIENFKLVVKLFHSWFDLNAEIWKRKLYE